jgi:hypothetical protein
VRWSSSLKASAASSSEKVWTRCRSFSFAVIAPLTVPGTKSLTTLPSENSPRRDRSDAYQAGAVVLIGHKCVKSQANTL